MKEIKRIHPASIGTVFGIALALFGLVAGVLFASSGLLLRQSGILALPFKTTGSFTQSLIIMPLYYGILGFVLSYLGAAVYNMVANWVGGIKIQLDDVEE